MNISCASYVRGGVEGQGYSWTLCHTHLIFLLGWGRGIALYSTSYSFVASLAYVAYSALLLALHFDHEHLSIVPFLLPWGGESAGDDAERARDGFSRPGWVKCCKMYLLRAPQGSVS